MWNWFNRKPRSTDPNKYLFKAKPLAWDSLTADEQDALLEQRTLLEEGGMETVGFRSPGGVLVEIPTNMLDAWEEIPEEDRILLMAEMERSVQAEIDRKKSGPVMDDSD